MENVRNTGFKHCVITELASVLVRGFREVGDIVVRIIDERRVIIHGDDNLCRGRTWPDSQTLVLERSALDLRF